MKVAVLLADKGTQNPQAATLNLLNVGWSRTQLQSPVPGMAITPPHTVAIFYEVEPGRCNRQIELALSLVTEDGTPVQLPGPAGPQPMELRQPITVVSPAGMPLGSPGTGNAMIEIYPGLPLTPGGYEWRVTLDGEHEEAWSATFRVDAPFGQPSLGGIPPTA